MSGINVNFGATDAGFSSTISKVKDSTKSLESTVEKTSDKVNIGFASMAKAGAALALGFGAIKMAAAAVSGTLGTFKEALDLGGTLSDLSDQTGETAGKLLILRRAFENNGLEADNVGTSINKMQRTLVEASDGSETAKAKFERLGLSLSDMQTKTPTEQLKMLAAAISGLPTPAERSAAAIEWFGKSGGRALAFLTNFTGAVDDAKGELGSMPDIMDKNARTFDTISDKITVIGGKFKEFAAGMLGEMTPMLELITTAIARIDFAGFGQRIAQAFIGGTQAMDGFSAALAAMKIGEFSLAFEIAFASVKLQAVQSANSIVANFNAAIATSVEFISIAFGPGSGMFTVITKSFEVIGNLFSRSIISALKTVAEALSKVFDGPMLDALKVIAPVSAALIEGFTHMGNSFDIAIKNMDTEVAMASKTMKNAMGQIPGDFILAAQEAKKSFEDSLKSSGKLIETSGIELDLQNSKLKLMKLQNEQSLEAIKNQGDFSELEIKIGANRISNAGRIKELEAEITNAKAQGNKELEAQLTAQKAYYEQLERSLAAGKDNQVALNEASKAYEVSLKNSVNDAGKLANLQKAIKDDMVQIKTVGDLIAATNAAAPMKTFSEKTKDARVDLKALADFMGGDFSRMAIPDIAKKLGIDIARKSSKQLLDEIQKKMDEIKKKEINININKKATKEQLKDVQKDIANLDTKKTITLDASSSISGIRKEMGAEIDLGLSSSRGTDFLGKIFSAAEDIKKILEKIEPKLPTVALGA